MNDFLLHWLSLSLSGSLAALAFILLRPGLRRFSKTWQYYLWLLVILRLLVPVSLDINIVGGLFQQAETYFSHSNALLDGMPEKESQQLPSLNVPDPADNDLQKAQGGLPLFSSWGNHIWGILWLAAAAFFFFRKIYGYIRFAGAVRKESRIIVDGQLPSALQSVCAAMGIKKKFLVCTNPFIRAPMLIGVMKPMVVLPDKPVQPSELIYIFRHELTHYRRMDIFYKWLVELAVCLHWFNPLVYWVRGQINRDCEFSCDEAVVSGLGNAQRITYGETLLHSIDITRAGRRKAVSLSLNEDGRLIKERLCAIMQYKRKSKQAVLAAVVLTAFLLCGTVFAGVYPVTAAENPNTGTAAPGPVLPKDETVQTVVYNAVEMRRYEGEDGHPYIHNVKTNNTAREIVGYQRGMLAFDIDGNPLKIDWWSIDSELDSEYFYLCEHSPVKIAAGATEDVYGGWSLNFMGNDSAAEDIAYVLYCDKEITFENGTVWENPDFKDWRSAYEGKKIDAADLESYYPYEQKIVLK